MEGRSRTNYGRVDILINNAGINTNSMRTHEYSVADWDRLMAINLRGVFLTTRKALALMLPGPGSIINISSILGLARLLAGLARGLDQLFGGEGRRDRLHAAGRGRIRRGENPLQRHRAGLAWRHCARRRAPRRVDARGHQAVRGGDPRAHRR